MFQRRQDSGGIAGREQIARFLVGNQRREKGGLKMVAPPQFEQRARTAVRAQPAVPRAQYLERMRDIGIGAAKRRD